MAKYVNLELFAVNKPDKIVVVICSEVPKGFDVLKKTFCSLCFQLDIMFIELIAKPEDHWIGGVVDLTMNMVEGDGIGVNVSNRSEEHTSELQSLMRISYAVF